MLLQISGNMREYKRFKHTLAGACCHVVRMIHVTVTVITTHRVVTGAIATRVHHHTFVHIYKQPREARWTSPNVQPQPQLGDLPHGDNDLS